MAKQKIMFILNKYKKVKIAIMIPETFLTSHKFVVMKVHANSPFTAFEEKSRAFSTVSFITLQLVETVA